ncbi:unnamed protein product [Paramecium sonneborni]|uniref:Uncharacterized protein n=1 Tax=Paramecium sonneborni TaxID=65129 RepID=A0A8S1R1Y0_9CILI|nr:unnamed protein product [Paramecium sonneborni]
MMKLVMANKHKEMIEQVQNNEQNQGINFLYKITDVFLFFTTYQIKFYLKKRPRDQTVFFRLLVQNSVNDRIENYSQRLQYDILCVDAITAQIFVAAKKSSNKRAVKTLVVSQKKYLLIWVKKCTNRSVDMKD